jgi:hypothetical protein
MPEIWAKVQARKKRYRAERRCLTCGAPAADGLLKCRDCHDKSVAAVKRHRLELRRQVYSAYGSKCACCGESNFLLLSIDFVKGQELQLLCLGCNSGKNRWECCPHQRTSEARQQILIDSAARLRYAGWTVLPPANGDANVL